MLDSTDRRTVVWLCVGGAAWLLTGPVLAALATNSTAAFTATTVWLLVPLAYAAIARDAHGIGVTLEHLRPALLDAIVLTALYSVVRLGVVALVPALATQVAGGPLAVAEALRTVELGTWRAPRASTVALTFAAALVAAVGVELFYRGFLFTRIQRSTHWIVALLASALLFGGYQYFASGPIAAASGVALSLAAGWLMARYGNVLAPVLFHYLQYVATVLAFYFLP